MTHFCTFWADIPGLCFLLIIIFAEGIKDEMNGGSVCGVGWVIDVCVDLCVDGFACVAG